MSKALPLAVLVSGEGTTMEAIAEAVAGGHLAARVTVVADRPHARAIERARGRGLPTAVLPFHGTPEPKWAAELEALLRDRGTELVVLAGFRSILPPRFLAAWRGRVINVHPSLLPDFGGRGMFGPHVLEAVLRAGIPETGATVHVVTEDVDLGPILSQIRTPVLPDDTVETLGERLRPLEHRLLIDVLREFADGRRPLPAQTSEGRAARERRDGA